MAQGSKDGLCGGHTARRACKELLEGLGLPNYQGCSGEKESLGRKESAGSPEDSPEAWG